MMCGQKTDAWNRLRSQSGDNHKNESHRVPQPQTTDKCSQSQQPHIKLCLEENLCYTAMDIQMLCGYKRSLKVKTITICQEAYLTIVGISYPTLTLYAKCNVITMSYVYQCFLIYVMANIQISIGCQSH